MTQNVIAKQHNSKMCFVCGLKNSAGLKASFYEVEGNQLVALFTPCDEHQGYPDRLHGGIAATILDETIGRAMKRNSKGHIFNIASRAGKYGFPDSGLYSASKFGLVGLSEALYREFSPCGVKVTAICPGWVNTDMAREAGASVEDEEMIQPSDVLASIRYILGLSGPACVRELVIECSKSIL